MLNKKLLGTSSGLPQDDNFENVTLLLNGDGTNGGQNNTFVDSSTNNFTITRNGNTTQGSFSPYGSLWSNFFNGSSSYLTAPASSIVNFGTGDFIVEAWFNCSTTSGNNKILDNYNGNNNANPTLLLNLDGAGKVSWYSGQTSVIASSTTFTVNTWNHVVVSRVSSTTKMFLNGSEVGSVSDTRNYAAGNTNVGIGGEPYSSGGSAFNGYISNLRIVKGSGVTSVTVPTAPLTAISGTALLTCQSNRFIDNSSNAYTITANGSPSVQRFSPFEPSAPYSTSVIGGSGYFDGSGDYLRTSSNVSLGSTYTFEAWVYFTAVSTGANAENSIFGSGSANGIDFGYGGSTGTRWFMAIYGAGFTVESANTTIQLNTWYHVAWVKNGTTGKIYVNGVEVASGTYNPSNVPTTGISIGSYGTVGAVTGYISDARYVDGTAVYTTGFTPPTSPLTAITNTALLCNFTNASIADLAMQNNLETVGNAQVSTSVKKYGTGSLYFDGTGDALIDYDLANLNSPGSGDWTFETWVYFNSLPSSFSALYHLKNDASTSTTVFIVEVTSAGRLSLSTGTALITEGTSGLITSGSWIHIAVTRSSGTFRTFINGVQDKSVSDSTTYNGTHNLFGVWRYSGSDNYINGYMDDIRITKGLARYTANFTPPASALPTY